MKNLSKLKEFAGDNFNLVENGRKLFKQVENTVGKRGQFLLFPECFQKTCTADTKKPGLVWERLNEELIHVFFQTCCSDAKEEGFFFLKQI